MRTSFDAGEMVDDVMRREPATIRVFLRHGMACVGCAVGPYRTVAEVSAEHGLAVAPFLRELAEASANARKKG